ncbi:MAG: hypothetical protein DCF28_06660 [Alphaproteobacteria bacterium]|nr:MAG: hypothetical protein DCF28_06660 [Alphaproteobacteria bacterium]PZO39883.1 MAG: hypothetical protein DCE92_03545 [Alphaproteobacteria bacterium]
MNEFGRRFATAAIILGLFGVAACATPANPVMMTLPATQGLTADPGTPGYRSVTTVNVAGGQETNPLWVSQVSDANFKAALEASLEAANYLGAEGQPTIVNATLMALKQPLAGLDLSVTSQVRYTVTTRGEIVFDELVSATGTATVGDAFVATERLRIANEKSVKENIKQFLTRLRNSMR